MSDRGLVLIVDDDASSAKMLQTLLKQEGYAVNRAGSGDDLLKIIRTADPNLVLLDAKISDPEPFELLDSLKKAEHPRDVPLIVLTTLDDEETRVKGLE